MYISGLIIKIMSLFLVLLAVLIASIHCRKVPNLLEKISKTSGLRKTSEKLWDVLFISDINTKIEENVADLNDGINNVCTFCATH